tara:strand:- start:193 stop:423 length:231 start_codon:yes stop_codon:yes gene_type:complete
MEVSSEEKAHLLKACDILARFETHIEQLLEITCYVKTGIDAILGHIAKVDRFVREATKKLPFLNNLLFTMTDDIPV